MEKINSFASHFGIQELYKHKSIVNDCDMSFGIFIPPQVKKENCPIVWYLSGLTCTHLNVIEKGEYRKKASELGLIIICPDTSPRGENIPDEINNWQFGSGAGFYLDAQISPYSNNYNMYSYISSELPDLVSSNFPVNMNKQGIMGHSMGGHGAIIIALKNPNQYLSCSALAPIANPTEAGWSKGAFEKYLGKDKQHWRQYDSTFLIEDGFRFDNFLIDQGLSDPFLNDGLKPNTLKEMCKKVKQPLTLRMHEGYDHSYYFISTFMEDHLNWHNKIMNNSNKI